MSATAWALVFACAAVVATCTGVLAWRRRDRTPAAPALAVTMSGVATWSTADVVLYGVGSDAVIAAYPPLLLASVGLVVVGAWVLSHTVSDPSWRLSRRSAALLAVEPLLLATAAALPATGDLVMSSLVPAGSGTEPAIVFGPLFLAHTAYSYVLVAIATARLMRRYLRSTGVFRRQVSILLLSAALSAVGNVVAVATQPLFFLATGLIDCFAIFRGGLLRLVPVARDQVVDTVPTPSSSSTRTASSSTSTRPPSGCCDGCAQGSPASWPAGRWTTSPVPAPSPPWVPQSTRTDIGSPRCGRVCGSTSAGPRWPTRAGGRWGASSSSVT
jgi:hypothetical protein